MQSQQLGQPKTAELAFEHHRLALAHSRSPHRHRTLRTVPGLSLGLAAETDYPVLSVDCQPGDVIVTGTPGGVGNKRNPQVFMKPGDVCEIVVDAIGTLRNGIRDDA